MSRCAIWGYWHPELGLDIYPLNKVELRSDLSGIVFKTASNHDPPFVRTIDVNSVEDVKSRSGYILEKQDNLQNIILGPSLYGDIWESLQRKTNFSYSMVTFCTFVIYHESSSREVRQ